MFPSNAGGWRKRKVRNAKKETEKEGKKERKRSGEVTKSEFITCGKYD